MLRDIRIHQLSDVDGRQFSDAMKLYAGTFPPNESRPVRETAEMVRSSDHYLMFVATDDSETLGFMLVYTSERFALLDYMAVYENFRSKGIGGRMLSYIVREVLSESRPTMLLEVQHVQEPDSDQKAARLRFYKNHGAVIVDEGYLMPGYGGPEIMNLMAITRDGRIQDSLQAMTEEIRENVYGRGAEI